jgi:hypothetical protein
MIVARSGSLGMTGAGARVTRRAREVCILHPRTKQGARAAAQLRAPDSRLQSSAGFRAQTSKGPDVAYTSSFVESLTTHVLFPWMEAWLCLSRAYVKSDAGVILGTHDIAAGCVVGMTPVRSPT